MAYNNVHPNAGSSGLKPGQSPTVQEFSIRVPKNNKKKFHVMRFMSNLNVDFIKWKSQNMQIKMERENNLKEFKGMEEDMPKFGAGSEFGREQREEARKKKYGFVAKKYKPDDQPWILKLGGKTGKKFKGTREGGVNENTAYYVFTQAGNGIIEAHPLQEWYIFQAIQRYKALSAEEAEEQFGRRNKMFNYFSLMTKKRLRGNEEDGDLDDPDEVKGKKGGAKKKKNKGDLKISEMDDWIDSDDMSDSDEDGKKSDDDDDNGRGKGKKKNKNKKGAPKKKKKDSDDEAIEESDDGDEEGRELDYISDSSESASDHEMKVNKELKGVAEEDALRKLLNSESEDEEENEEKKDEEASNSEDEESKNKKEKEEKDGNEKTKESSKKKKPSKKDKKLNKNGKNAAKKNDGESSSELSPNSTDSDSDSGSKNKSSNKTKDTTNSADSSRSATPTLAPTVAEKRKLTPSELAVAATKKAKLESSTPSGSNSSHLLNCESGITEDAVRRYLMRKPMTTTELLQKFKSKKSGLSSSQMVNILTPILKNINPHIQNIQNKKYLSIRSS